jgi:hypothetical protein
MKIQSLEWRGGVPGSAGSSVGGRLIGGVAEENFEAFKRR